MRTIAPGAPARRFADRIRALACAAACAAVLGALDVPLPARAADPWLFVNDVHFDPKSKQLAPNLYGDTDKALLDSALTEMHRIAPNPPVIVMAGDFLAHNFKRSSAAPTMIALAERFNRTFPRAQFVMALGNEDSPCG